MTFEVILIVLLVAVVAGVGVRRAAKTRHERRMETARNFRLSRKVADEDVTAFGEELTDLHVETLTTAIDDDMRTDYQRALDSYETAKDRIRDANDEAGVTQATKALEDGRFAMACVLARRDEVALPLRRPPCFFNPTHGPAATDVEWAPPGGVTREIPVCFGCEERLAGGERPDTRLVRWGNRYVPWYQAGGPYQSYVEGYYGGYVRQDLFPAFVLIGGDRGPQHSRAHRHLERLGRRRSHAGTTGPARSTAAATAAGGDGGSADGGDGGGDGGGWRRRRRGRRRRLSVRPGAGGVPPRRSTRSSTGRP